MVRCPLSADASRRRCSWRRALVTEPGSPLVARPVDERSPVALLVGPPPREPDCPCSSEQDEFRREPVIRRSRREARDAIRARASPLDRVGSVRLVSTDATRPSGSSFTRDLSTMREECSAGLGAICSCSTRAPDGSGVRARHPRRQRCGRSGSGGTRPLLGANTFQPGHLRATDLACSELCPQADTATHSWARKRDEEYREPKKAHEQSKREPEALAHWQNPAPRRWVETRTAGFSTRLLQLH